MVVAVVIVFVLSFVVLFARSGIEIPFLISVNNRQTKTESLLSKRSLSPDLWSYFPESKLIPPIKPYGPYFPLENMDIDKIVAFDDVLNETETMYLIDVMSDYCETFDATANTEPARVTLNKTPWVCAIERRIAKLMQVDPKKLEPIELCRKRYGDKTNPHTDILEDGGGAAGQRLSTMVVFLNNLPPLEDGGRIIFNRINVGLYPKAGTGIAWNNVDIDTLETDHDMWHTHQPIHMENSIKYILVAYSREREYVG